MIDSPFLGQIDFPRVFKPTRFITTLTSFNQIWNKKNFKNPRKFLVCNIVGPCESSNCQSINYASREEKLRQTIFICDRSRSAAVEILCENVTGHFPHKYESRDEPVCHFNRDRMSCTVSLRQIWKGQIIFCWSHVGFDGTHRILVLLWKDNWNGKTPL